MAGLDELEAAIYGPRPRPWNGRGLERRIAELRRYRGGRASSRASISRSTSEVEL